MPVNDPIYGVNPKETIALLKQRAFRLKQRRSVFDGRKLGLIIEGGAMRGVISCAALLGLEELGMTEVFDEVYGASAGAVNSIFPRRPGGLRNHDLLPEDQQYPDHPPALASPDRGYRQSV